MAMAGMEEMPAAMEMEAMGEMPEKEVMAMGEMGGKVVQKEEMVEMVEMVAAKGMVEMVVTLALEGKEA